jgi:CheY-like chemotaxis protein
MLADDKIGGPDQAVARACLTGDSHFSRSPDQQPRLLPSFIPVLIIVDDYAPSQRLLTELSLLVGLQPIVCHSTTELYNMLKSEMVVGVVLDTENHSMSAKEVMQVLQACLNYNAESPIVTLTAALSHSAKRADRRSDHFSNLSKPICVNEFYKAFDGLFVPRLEALRQVCQVRLMPDQIRIRENYL